MTKIFEKANSKYLIILFAVILLLLACGLFSRANVSDNGIAEEHIKSEITEGRRELSEAGTAISRGKESANQIRQSNNNIRKSIESSEYENNSSRQLLSECQQILRDLPKAEKQ